MATNPNRQITPTGLNAFEAAKIATSCLRMELLLREMKHERLADQALILAEFWKQEMGRLTKFPLPKNATYFD